MTRPLLTGRASLPLTIVFSYLLAACGTVSSGSEGHTRQVSAWTEAAGRPPAAAPALPSVAEDLPRAESEPRAAVASDLGPKEFAFLATPPTAKDWARAREADSVRRVSERRARAMLLARSPTIRAAWHGLRAARTRHSQVRDLERLMSVYRAFQSGPNPSEGERSPGPATLAGRVVAADIAAAEVRFEIATRDALTRLTEAFQRARLAILRLQVLGETHALSKRVVGVVESRFQASQGATKADLLRARMRRDRLGQQLQAARDEVQVSRRVLAATLDLERPVSPRAGLGLRRLGAAKAARRAASRGPDVRLAAHRHALAEAALALAERQLLPSAAPGPKGVRDPLPRSAPAVVGQAHLAELRARVAEAEAALLAARRRADAGASRQHAQARDAYRRVRLDRVSLRPQARRALEATEAEYTVGLRPYAELDDATETWLNVALSGYEARRDAHVAAIRLQRLTGEVVPEVGQIPPEVEP